MISVDTIRSIELFHLLFLRHLGERVDRKLFALKGGCNLRFFLKSIRLSEDMDLDIHTASAAALANNVRRIFETRSFLSSLEARGIRIERNTEAKQTSTTQRWKIGLRIIATGSEVPTKLEFSRRKSSGQVIIEPADPELCASLDLLPVLAPHYSKAAALNQKIGALIHRTQTQARDVFDLTHLKKSGAKTTPRQWSHDEIATAQQNALSLSFADFKGQVLAFLLPEYQVHYDNEGVWDAMVAEVVDLLEALKHDPA